jgi:hypothetical protein
MLEAIRTMPAEILAYKSFSIFREPLETFLEAQATA